MVSTFTRNKKLSVVFEKTGLEILGFGVLEASIVMTNAT